MTSIYIEVDGGRVLVTAQGHATGSDNMCGAISGILYALAGFVHNKEREGTATIYAFRAEPGDFVLHFHADGDAMAAVEMTTIGLQQLEQAEPELIRVEFPENL